MIKETDLPEPSSALVFLHRVDPRLQLLAVVCGMTAVFSARTANGLLLPAMIIIGLLVVTGGGRRMVSLLWHMRWLFLSILLLHLLLTPGRTLFGSLFLSQAGLLRGGLVCGQLMLAAALALILAVFCQPERLAAALQSLLAPAGLFRRPVQRFAGQVLLTLQLVPLLRELWASVEPRLQPDRRRPRRRLQTVVNPLLTALIERVDALAYSSAVGDAPFPPLQPLQRFTPFSSPNMLFLFLLGTVFTWWLI